MAALAFDLLDRHVVAGLGDELACAGDVGALSFAQLLERSAALAGGLQALGVALADVVDVQATGVQRVVVVCACVRLGAVPGDGGVAVVTDDEVRMRDDTVALDMLMKAGATDPAPSLAGDEPGFRAAVRSAASDVVDALLVGQPIT